MKNCLNHKIKTCKLSGHVAVNPRKFHICFCEIICFLVFFVLPFSLQSKLGICCYESHSKFPTFSKRKFKYHFYTLTSATINCQFLFTLLLITNFLTYFLSEIQDGNCRLIINFTTKPLLWAQLHKTHWHVIEKWFMVIEYRTVFHNSFLKSQLDRRFITPKWPINFPQFNKNLDIASNGAYIS